jgi:hypothetical protein
MIVPITAMAISHRQRAPSFVCLWLRPMPVGIGDLGKGVAAILLGMMVMSAAMKLTLGHSISLSRPRRRIQIVDRDKREYIRFMKERNPCLTYFQ